MIPIFDLISAPERWLSARALRLTKNAEDAKDLVQETLFRAYKSRKSFKEEGNFDGWLNVILLHAFRSNLKMNKALKRTIPPLLQKDIVSHNPAEQNIDYKIRLIWINRSLTPLQRKIMNLVQNGYGPLEISELLNYSNQYVKDNIVKARKKIKKYDRL